MVAQLASVDVRPDAKLPDMQQWLDQHQLPFRRRLLQQGGQFCQCSSPQLVLMTTGAVQPCRSICMCCMIFAYVAIRPCNTLVCVTTDGKYNTAQIGDVAVTWATSSVAWLVSIIILIFIIASAVCLCNVRLTLSSCFT